MLTVFVDGSYESTFKIGAFCIVWIDKKGKKHWQVYECNDCESSNEVEHAGIVKAIEELGVLSKLIIYCDNMNALRKAQKADPRPHTLRHIKGHQYTDKIQPIHTLEARLHNWADVQARWSVTERMRKLNKTLDKTINTSV